MILVRLQKTVSTSLSNFVQQTQLWKQTGHVHFCTGMLLGWECVQKDVHLFTLFLP